MPPARAGRSPRARKPAKPAAKVARFGYLDARGEVAIAPRFDAA